MAKVLNKRVHGIPAGAVYVGRPTEWGNPFHMAEEHQRDQVCDLFEDSLTPEFKLKIKKELKGKDLVCWCAPKRCHADTLVRIANE